MKRTIINIDEEKCTGCGLCISGCHEGALQLIDGKARLISELFCDGLGACIGDCPEGAITLEEREAEPYDEIKTLERMLPNGKTTVLAHLNHLREHGEKDLLHQALGYLLEKKPENMSGVVEEFRESVHGGGHKHGHSGCPGSQAMSLKDNMHKISAEPVPTNAQSELGNWPVQLHLAGPAASYFRNADVVLAADCVAFAMANFHQNYLKGRTLVIACPKLDSGKEIYLEKLKAMIDDASINTLTVVIMEVPCCSGLLQLAKIAASEAKRKVPVKVAVISIKGEVLKEEWI